MKAVLDPTNTSNNLQRSKLIIWELFKHYLLVIWDTEQKYNSVLGGLYVKMLPEKEFLQSHNKQWLSYEVHKTT